MAKLPVLPNPPVFDVSGYPACTEKRSWESLKSRIDRFAEVQHCIDDLERYNLYALPSFPRAVRSYTIQLNVADANFRRSDAKREEKQAFARTVQQRIAAVASKDNKSGMGESYLPYYQAIDRYKRDVGRLIILRNNGR